MDTTTKRLIHLIKQAQAQYSEEYLVIAIPNFISKKFIAYCSMREDLELILKYINEIRSKPSKIVKSALTYSLISLYGKCFTDASKNSYPKLEASHLFQEGEETFETHNFLMELRHQFIAHRGETESEIGISYMLIKKEGASDTSEIRFSQLKQISFSKEELNNIETLTSFLVNRLNEKIQKSGQKVHDGMLSLFTPKQLALMSANNIK